MTARPPSLRTRLHNAVWLPRASDDAPSRLQRRAVYPMLALVVLALGVNWPIMSIGLRSVTPIWIATFRLFAAMATLFLITGMSGRLSPPPRADYPVVVSVGILRLALVFTLVFYGLEIVPPGRSSVLVWTSSLWIVPIAAVFLGERMNRGRWLGLAAGMLGILSVFEPTRLDWTDGEVVLGHALLLGAAVSHAVVGAHIRHHTFVSSPLRLMPWQLAVGFTPILLIALITEGTPSIDWSIGLVANIAFQGIVVSGFAVWGQMTVLRSNPAISTGLGLMAVPAIGLLASVLIVGETLTPGVVVGLILILGGVLTASRAG